MRQELIDYLKEIKATLVADFIEQGGEVLDLSYETTNEQTTKIVELLKDTDGISTVHFPQGTVGTDLIKIIAEALVSHKTIVEFSCTNSKIDDDAAGYIVDLIKTNDKIIKIDLSWNKFTDRGANEILAELRTKQTYPEIILDNNKITKSVLQQIEQPHNYGSILPKITESEAIDPETSYRYFEEFSLNLKYVTLSPSVVNYLLSQQSPSTTSSGLTGETAEYINNDE